MSKPRTPNQKKRYAALNKRLAKYTRMVQYVYDETARSAAELAIDCAYAPEAGKPFSFSNYPKIRSKVRTLQEFFVRDLHALILSSTSEEWKQSNIVQDLLANDVLKAYGIKRRGEKHKVYYQTNSDALKAFQTRKDLGLTVSQKLWNQSESMLREMECCIASAIEKGTSAITLSNRISKYLRDYPAMAKDYKAKFGKAANCQNCEYRSIRLARSEINMSYRMAEQERWKQMDFIKGYRIKLSGAHPKRDMCDDLAGVYPKDFLWLGWHPNCMCYCIPIIMTEDEYWNGKGKMIEEVPPQATMWVMRENAIEAATKKKRSRPNWVTFNKEMLRTPDHVKEHITPSYSDIEGEPGYSEYVSITRKEAKSKLKALSDNFTHEEAYVFLLDGKVLHKYGDKEGVSFMTSEMRSFEGAALIHNHGKSTLSPEDVNFAIKNRLGSMSAIADGKEHKLTLPKDALDALEGKSFVTLYTEAENETYDAFLKADSKKADKIRGNYQEEILKRLFKKTGLKFSKRTIKG